MSELSELERLYLPSYWSKRYPPEDIVEKFVEITSKLSSEIREEIPCELDVAYGDQEKQKLDTYGIDLPNDAPIFIFIHGGYWQEVTIQKHTSNVMARSLYKNGCKTIIIGYTLCPDNSIDGIVQEIETAIKKCLKDALEKESRFIAIGGHSAGAHLITSILSSTVFWDTLTEEERNIIKSVFLIGGIYNLVPLVETTINDPLKLTVDTAKALSPMFQDFKHLAANPCFTIIVGENDSPVFIEQSQSFYDNLRNQEIKCNFQLLKELDHFDIIEKMDEDNYTIIELIVKSLN